MSKNNSKMFLYVIIFAVLLTNFAWLYLDKQPPEGNGLQDLLPAIEFYNFLKVSRLSNIFNAPFFSIYPPLVPSSYTLFYLIFGTKTEMELIVNSIYLIIMLLSIYGIGKKMFNEKVGLLSAFIVSSFPSVIAASRLVYAEFHLMCLTTLAIYMLLKTDYFTNRRYSIFLGISLALVALAKWEFPPMLIGPFAVILYRARTINSHIPYKTKLNNFIFSILIGLILSSFWYVPNFKNVIWRLFINPNENVFHFSELFPHKAVLSFNNFFYYALSLLNSHIFLIYFIMLTAAVFFFISGFFSNKNKSGNKWSALLLIMWIVIPYVAFTFVQIKGESHILAVLPPTALIISAWACPRIVWNGATGLPAGLHISKGILKKVIAPFIIVYGLIFHTHPFYNVPFLGLANHIKVSATCENHKFSLKPFIIEHASEARYWPSKGFSHPDERNWQVKEVLNFIRSDTALSNKDPIILILSRDINFNWSCFQYVNLLGFNSYIVPSGNTFVRAPLLLDIDYIALKYDSHSYYHEWNVIMQSMYFEFFDEKRYRWIDEHIIKGKKNYFDNFVIIGEFRLPDGSFAKIFRLNKKTEEANI